MEDSAARVVNVVDRHEVDDVLAVRVHVVNELFGQPVVGLYEPVAPGVAGTDGAPPLVLVHLIDLLEPSIVSYEVNPRRILHGRRAVREIRRTLSNRILSILASALRLDGVVVVLGASFLMSTSSIGEVAFFVRLGTLLDCANICGGHWPVSLRDLGCRASREAAGEGRERRRCLSLKHRCCRIHQVHPAK